MKKWMISWHNGWYLDYSETIQNEHNEKKYGFLSMSLGTVGAILLENLLSNKGGKQSGSSNIHGWELIGPGEGD